MGLARQVLSLFANKKEESPGQAKQLKIKKCGNL
jgi:hypothetical protein